MSFVAAAWVPTLLSGGGAQSLLYTYLTVGCSHPKMCPADAQNQIVRLCTVTGQLMEAWLHPSVQPLSTSVIPKKGGFWRHSSGQRGKHGHTQAEKLVSISSRRLE